MDDHTAAVLVAAASPEARTHLPTVLGWAAELVIKEGWCTLGLVRQRLQVNDRTAEYLVHQLEAWGIVGAHRGNRPRVVNYGPDRLPWVLECIAQYDGEVPDTNPLARTAGSELTDKHLGVIRLAALGFTNKAIAARLHVSEDTVKKRLKESCGILGAHGRANLVHRAHEENVNLPSADLARGKLIEDERRVLRETAKGLTNAEVAAELEMSIENVKQHVAGTYRIFGAKDPANAVHLGWLNDELPWDDEETPT